MRTRMHHNVPSKKRRFHRGWKRQSTRPWGAFALLLLTLLPLSIAKTQEQPSNSRFESWLELQAVPSFVLTSRSGESAFGFQWGATPLLYSFGMTRLISPWHSFIVEPPARFTGSIELFTTGQINTTKIGNSYFAGSVQLLGHIPLIERGEYLALNLGAARYSYGDWSSSYGVLGVSTLFGFVNFNLKHGVRNADWMGSFEIRFF
jgi:hypothetical protein